MTEPSFDTPNESQAYRPGWFTAYLRCLGMLLVSILPVILALQLHSGYVKWEKTSAHALWLLIPIVGLILAAPLWFAHCFYCFMRLKKNAEWRAAIERLNPYEGDEPTIPRD